MDDGNKDKQPLLATGSRTVCGDAAVCMQCRRRLTADEAALHKKLFNRAADRFFCIDCSAAYLGVTRELLEEKIRQFKNMGCTLFK